MDEQDLDAAMMRDIQLHESVTIIYVVDGWKAQYSPDDGNTFIEFFGVTPMHALKKCFSNENKRQKPKRMHP